MATGTSRILVVAHRTAATPTLLDAVRARTRQGPASFVLLIPRPYWDPETEEAARVVELAVPLLENAAGGRVEAVVGDTDPFVAVQQALEGSAFDEVIISTLPRRVSQWLGLDLPARVRRLGVPVSVVTPEPAGGAEPPVTTVMTATAPAVSAALATAGGPAPAAAPSVISTRTATGVQLHIVAVENPAELNLILGQSHFIKTVEDLHEVLAGASPQLRFGVAFCEASGPRLVRRTGNDPELVDLAVRNALAIGAGHAFIVFLRDGFPVNVLNQIKLVPEVCRIYCATANPVDVVVGETPVGRGIVGVVDGGSPLGVEGDADIAARHRLLRQIGYKL